MLHSDKIFIHALAMYANRLSVSRWSRNMGYNL